MKTWTEFTECLRKKNFSTPTKRLTVEDTQLDEFKVVVPHQSETLGIPRHAMPQIVGTEYDDYFKYLEDNGIELKRENVKVGTLKAIQGEFDETKIVSMIVKHQQQGSSVDKLKPLIVSADNFVIDGNHRLLAMQNISRNMVIPVIRLKTTMGHALQLTKMYPKVKFKNLNDDQRKKDAADPDGGAG